MVDNNLENANSKKQKSQIIYSIIIAISASSIPALRGYYEGLILVGIVSSIFNLLVGFFTPYLLPQDIWELIGLFSIKSKRKLLIPLSFLWLIILCISLDIIKGIFGLLN